MPASFAYRSFRLLRRITPPGIRLRFLLGASWLFDRLAYEEFLLQEGWARGLQVLRPHTAAFLGKHLTQTDSVLELGPGDGATTRLIAEHAQAVTAVDRSSLRLEHARRNCADLPNVDFVLSDVADRGQLTKQLGSVDYVVALHLLEHLERPGELLASLGHISDNLILEVPDFDSNMLNAVRYRLGTPYWTDDDHCSEFTAETLSTLLHAAGWAVSTCEKHSGVLLIIAGRG